MGPTPRASDPLVAEEVAVGARLVGGAPQHSTEMVPTPCSSEDTITSGKIGFLESKHSNELENWENADAQAVP